MADKKRTLWTTDESLKVVQAACDQHQRFLSKKRARKTSEFWQELGAIVGHSGDQTERLFKNLSSEFQKLRQLYHVSGVATDMPPALRGSEELFILFESFYSLYYPQGGSVLPRIILTESSLTYTMDSTPATHPASVSPSQSTSVLSIPSVSVTIPPPLLRTSTLQLSSSATQPTVPAAACSPPQPGPSSVTQQHIPSSVIGALKRSATVPAAACSPPQPGPSPATRQHIPSSVIGVLKRSRPTIQKRCRSAHSRKPQFHMEDLVRLQTRQLQVERQRLIVERKKLECLEGIHAQLFDIKAVLMQAHGVVYQVQEE